MKLILLNIFLLITAVCFSQEIVIAGKSGNRPLSWNDFSGKADKNSSLDANTFWRITYSYEGVTLTGDIASFTGLTVKLQLDAKLSWRKKNAETADLLTHEQGHFDIGRMCQKDLLINFSTTAFTKNNFDNELKEIFKRILKKYDEIGQRYDAETNHSKDKKAQDRWNELFKTELNSTP